MGSCAAGAAYFQARGMIGGAGRHGSRPRRRQFWQLCDIHCRNIARLPGRLQCMFFGKPAEEGVGAWTENKSSTPGAHRGPVLPAGGPLRPGAGVPIHAVAGGTIRGRPRRRGPRRRLRPALRLRFCPHARQVTGIDLTPAMIEQARRRQREEGLANLRWEVGDAVPPCPMPTAPSRW